MLSKFKISIIKDAILNNNGKNALIFVLYSFVGHFVYSQQTCTSGGDQLTYGNGSWIGYVYDHNGSGNPVSNPFATYQGFVTEAIIFDRNWGNASTSSPSCSAGSGNNFAVRYKMTTNFSGTYTFTIGGDDGVRLSIDGGATWLISAWSDHSYNTTTSGTVVLNGNYNLIIEYYEKGGDARASFSYTQVSSSFLMPEVNSVISSCSGSFFDSGGASSNYSDNESRTLTIYPATCGAKLQVIFNSFNTENNYDGLSIYNGNSTSSSLISSGLGVGSNSTTCPAGSWRGSGSPGTIISSASDGSLTFVFKSDGSVPSSGWSATISCVGGGQIVGTDLCVGSVETLTVTTPFSTNNWASSNGSIANVNASTGLMTGVSAGNSVITYTGYYTSLVSCSITNSFNIISAPGITGTTTLCIGQSSDLTGTGEWTALPIGGTITTVGNDYVHKFTSSGTFNAPQAITNARILVVGGGGGGGQNGGGGGGAGAYMHSTGVSISSGNTLATVGAGGAAGLNIASSGPGSNGSSSVFGSITAVGGGGGASRDNGSGGLTGGSGGGGGGTTTSGAGTRNLAGSGTSGQGNNGGNGTPSDASCNAAGGGGGGAGSAGTVASNNVAGNGGAGLSNDITGAIVWYAGGGGGGTTNFLGCNGASSWTNGTGGAGGGGNGEGTDGTANTGGGGGAERAGGSGVVIVRYMAPFWTSSNTAVATVNGLTGLVTAVGSGTTTITFTNETGCSTSTTVTVNGGTNSTSGLVGGDFIWNGTVNTDWNTTTNWYRWNGSSIVANTSATLPTTGTNVIIPPTGSCVLNQPNLAANTGNTKSLLIETGAILTDGTGTLNVNGDWTNNGTFVYGTGLANFGGATSQTVGGTGTNEFYNAIVNNSSTGLILSAPVTVRNSFTMTQGDITTTSLNLLTIGVNATLPGTISWTSGAVVGPMKRWYQAVANSGMNTGILPVGTAAYDRWALLEYSTSPTTAGWITAEFKAINPTSTTAGTNGLTLVDQWNWQLDGIIPAGYWEITPTTLSGGIYNIKLRANNMTAPDYTVTRIIKSPSAHTTWTLNGIHGVITGTAADYQISRTGLSGYSYFAIAYPTNSPLPVELTSFKGVCTDIAGSELNWTTATEHNSAYYQVERSRDGFVWTEAGVVDAAGNSTVELNYQFSDPVPFEGVMYYRLTQYDLDGAFKVYPVIAVSCGGETEDVLKVYPNPSGSIFYVDYISVKYDGSLQLDIFDGKGVKVDSRLIKIQHGQNISELTLDLQAGLYLFVFTDEDGKQENIKHVIN